MEILQKIQKKIHELGDILSMSELNAGEWLYHNNYCQILTQSSLSFEVMVASEKEGEYYDYNIVIQDNNIYPERDKSVAKLEGISYACLLQIAHELKLLDPKLPLEHKKYSRKGMINRVLAERRHKADQAEYKILWANNIYGDHTVINDKGIRYKVFLRDFNKEIGYSDSKDSKYNKLGTTKHIMYAFRKLKEDNSLYEKLDKTFPFIEVYCNPLDDYKISWCYPHVMPTRERQWIKDFFGQKNYLDEDKVKDFLKFIEVASSSPLVVIRPEVLEKVGAEYEREMLEKLKATRPINFSKISANLYPYQKEGIQFAVFKKAAIIADEMGLGKTLQAIGVSIAKREIFDFKKTLIITPATLKGQWKNEIEKFTREKALVIEGFPKERQAQYQNNTHHFFIANYETVMRDRVYLQNAGIDFVILDEAQRIKNFETQTAAAVSQLKYNHILVLTGTPIENKLIDLFSIVNIISPNFFGPLWEFSYQHCLFDSVKPNKINGYFDLDKIRIKVRDLILRREKKDVLQQLPNVVQVDVPVYMTALQKDYHNGFASGVAQIVSKKFMTPYDLQHLQLLLAKMRMVCDSTYLIDEETYESPKLDELSYILVSKLNLREENKKVIIFSEWVKVHKLIGKMLREQNIGFAELNGSVPVKMRNELINKFENNAQCKVFLSTEAGGAGLNLQVADTLINFELPWNPAKKNQRIGRIDRLGQKNNTLTIYNFISKNSIEEQIASGLLLKQSVFDSVLSTDSSHSIVDLSSKGRSQFIEQLTTIVEKWKTAIPQEDLEEEIIIPTDEREIDAIAEIESDVVAIDDLVDDSSNNSMKQQPQQAMDSEMQSILHNGLQFLSGLMKLSTGKDMQVSEQQININSETGEVTLTFKLPK
jgi:SNF2 family DNA or RNA helicase